MEVSKQLKEKISSYTADEEKLRSIKDAPILSLAGIAGSGKSTLLHQLLEKYPQEYRFIVSHTTRAPRKNNNITEKDGVNYHFIDTQRLEKMLDNHEFVEAKVIHNSWVSGTSVSELQKINQAGKIGINDIDIQGIDAYVEMGLNVKPIFILPPNYDDWMERFTGRYNGNVPPAEMSIRLHSALRELEHALNVDHFYIVINDDIERARDLVHDITQGKPVERHYSKAVDIVNKMLKRISIEITNIK